MKNLKFIDLVLENCGSVRLEEKDVIMFHIAGVTESRVIISLKWM
ncbi:hypothetical protein [Staphylococcus hyicus]|uniref:Uncharacterized protein n=1 Tax=Staphylococcus hyicus TaxID=1284 RepID=A0ACD5FNX7_STAHY|nr:hypothetical protein [Staphylococcus hyicus]MDP4462599.1 hypothetical protein [Staphylococcus hyicus]SQE47292.1 Uncharacterised protein [Staphylococcus hyicus]